MYTIPVNIKYIEIAKNKIIKKNTEIIGFLLIITNNPNKINNTLIIYIIYICNSLSNVYKYNNLSLYII